MRAIFLVYSLHFLLILSTAYLTIRNPEPEVSDWFGYPVVATPDGNILVGVHGDNYGGDNSGSIYLFSGSDGKLLRTIRNPRPQSNSYFGYAIACTPNGNILTSAHGDSSNTGIAYLFSGTTGALLLTIPNP